VPRRSNHPFQPVTSTVCLVLIKLYMDTITNMVNLITLIGNTNQKNGQTDFLTRCLRGASIPFWPVTSAVSLVLITLMELSVIWISVPRMAKHFFKCVKCHTALWKVGLTNYIVTMTKCWLSVNDSYVPSMFVTSIDILIFWSRRWWSWPISYFFD
jgi:hypothetical protein